MIGRYLSSRNRAAAACPLATLATDVARESADKPVRSAFNAGLERLVELLSSVQLSDGTPSQRRDAALTQISTMVGALVLAKATKGKPVSDELLAAAPAQLLQP